MPAERNGCGMMRDDFYGPLLGHTSHLAKEHMRGRMSRYDMTPTQTHVLLYLHEHGQAAQCVLAEHKRYSGPDGGKGPSGAQRG